MNVSPLFRPEEVSPNSAPPGSTANHTTGTRIPRQTGASVPRHLVVLDSRACKHDNGGSTPISSPREYPANTNGERGGGKSHSRAKSTCDDCGSSNITLRAAPNKRRQRHKQQQQPQCTTLHQGTRYPSGAEEGFFHISPGSRPGAARAAVGSEGYLEKRKQRAALSEDALRQLGSEHIKLKAL